MCAIIVSSDAIHVPGWPKNDTMIGGYDTGGLFHKATDVETFLEHV